MLVWFPYLVMKFRGGNFVSNFSMKVHEFEYSLSVYQFIDSDKYEYAIKHIQALSKSSLTKTMGNDTCRTIFGN